MVLDCKGWTGDVKAKVAEAHPSERIKRLYTPPEASWKRKFVSGCDEGGKDEPAKPPEPLAAHGRVAVLFARAGRGAARGRRHPVRRR